MLVCLLAGYAASFSQVTSPGYDIVIGISQPEYPSGVVSELNGELERELRNQ